MMDADDNAFSLHLFPSFVGISLPTLMVVLLFCVMWRGRSPTLSIRYIVSGHISFCAGFQFSVTSWVELSPLTCGAFCTY